MFRLTLRAVDKGANAALPGLVTVLAVLLQSTPSPLPSGVMPDVALMLVFVAAVARPSYFPLWLCFVCGVLTDLLGASVIGIHSLIYICVHAFAVSQALHFRMLSLMWIGFSMAVLGSNALQWLAAMASSGAWIDPTVLLTGVIVSIAAFPLLTYPLQRAIGVSRNG